MKLPITLILVTMAMGQDKPKPTEHKGPSASKSEMESVALAAKVQSLEQDLRFAALKEAMMVEEKVKQSTQDAYAVACKGAGLAVGPVTCIPDFNARKMVAPPTPPESKK